MDIIGFRGELPDYALAGLVLGEFKHVFLFSQGKSGLIRDGGAEAGVKGQIAFRTLSGGSIGTWVGMSRLFRYFSGVVAEYECAAGAGYGGENNYPCEAGGQVGPTERTAGHPDLGGLLEGY